MPHGFKAVRPQLRGARAVPADASRAGSWASPSPPSPSARWCPPRSCPSPAPISSPATSIASIIASELQRRAGKLRWRRSASLIVKVGALCFIIGCWRAEIRDQAAAAGRHLDHPDVAGRVDRALHALAPSHRALGRLGRRHRRRAQRWWPPKASQVRSMRCSIFGVTAPCYAAISVAGAQSGGQRGLELASSTRCWRGRARGRDGGKDYV